MEPIKRISKELQEEGLTVELVNRVLRMGVFSPVQFQKGDEPVKLLQANEKEFWVKLSDGTFLKDGKNLMKFDFKTCVFARARYLVKFEEKEKKLKVKEEIKRLQIEIDEKLKEVVNNIDNLFKWADFDIEIEKKKVGLEGALIAMAIQDGIENSRYFRESNAKKEHALNLFKETPREQFQAIKDNLLTCHSKKDYDNLHMMLMSNGLPLIGRFKFNNKEDMNLLIKMFHRDKLEGTLDLVKKKSHLEIVAKMNVEKEYI